MIVRMVVVLPAPRTPSSPRLPATARTPERRASSADDGRGVRRRYCKGRPRRAVKAHPARARGRPDNASTIDLAPPRRDTPGCERVLHANCAGATRMPVPALDALPG
jgi:hypothetical protein